MTIERHEHKTSNTHFGKLFDEFQTLTTSIENMETPATLVATQTKVKANRCLVGLKAELYRLLEA
jgi:uncharacterized protein YdcH (DUF465 family)